MKNLIIAFLFIFPILLSAQNVGINADGLAPHSSAQLDVRSFSKGILIPRIPNAQIENIPSPANGLIVYNSTLNKLVHYDLTNDKWLDVANMDELYRISDTDDDTKIIVEENPDEDQIKMYAAGNLMIQMKKDTMFIPQGVFSGYGTTNPLDPIHIKAEDNDEFAGFYAEGGANTKHVHYILDNRTGNGRRYSLVSVGDDSNIPNGSFAIRDLNLSTERLTIDSTGKVGINNNNPTARFHVNGEARINEFLRTDEHIRIGAASSNLNGNIQYTGTDFEGYVGGQWESLTGGSGSLTELSDADTDTKIEVEETPDADEISFYAKNSLVMKMEEDNMYVPQGVFAGYGITTPLDPIHIKAEDDDEFAGFYAEGGANTKHVHYILDNRTGNGRRYSLVSVGDDSSIPNGSFAIRDLNLSTERLTIDSTGKIGINNNNPTARLHVNGDTRISKFMRTDEHIRIGAASSNLNGNIQYTGTDFEGYIGGQWKSLTGTGVTGGLSDADADTKITVEETPDSDEINFYANNSLTMKMEEDNIFVPQGVFSGFGLTNPLDPIHIKAEDDDEFAGFYAEGGANTKHVHYILDNRTGNGRRYSIVSVGDDSNIPNGSFAIRDLNLSTERLTIDSTGKIGIGTNTPSAKLEIKDDSGPKGHINLVETDANDFARIQFTNEGSTDFWTVAAGKNSSDDRSSMNFSKNTLAHMRIHDTGKVQIFDTLELLNKGPLLMPGVIRADKNADGDPILHFFSDDNLFIGHSAGLTNTGFSNTFLGAAAGSSNIGGDNNTFIGRNAGLNNAGGNQNTFMGAWAGSTNTAGNNNTFVGYSSGELSTGNGSTFIGREVGKSETRSNILMIDNSNTAQPLLFGDFATDSLQVNGTARVTGDFLIGNELFTNTGANFIRLNSHFTPDIDDQFNLGGTVFRWKNVFATSGVVNTSDRRAKKNVEALNYGLKEVMQLRPVDFNWNKENSADKKTLGLIAQELLEVIPEVVVEPENAEDLYGVKYSDLVPVLIKAIQELKEENQTLHSEVSVLQTDLEDKIKEQEFFNDRLTRLEAKLGQEKAIKLNTRK